MSRSRPFTSDKRQGFEPPSPVYQTRNIRHLRSFPSIEASSPSVVVRAISHLFVRESAGESCRAEYGPIFHPVGVEPVWN